MAVIDYGAIAFKNGKLITTKMFTPVTKTIKFKSVPETINKFDNYFVCIGNENIIVGFYKDIVHWWIKQEDGSYEETTEWLSWSHYDGWKQWTQELCTANCIDWLQIKVKPQNGYYVAYINDRRNNDEYKVYFGYGVDVEFYKKTGRVNYYRSPEYFFKSLPYKIKNIIYDIKYTK